MKYEGEIPSIQFFEPVQMNKEKKDECETWHAEQVSKGVVWNFQTEILEYCKSDDYSFIQSIRRDLNLKITRRENLTSC